VGRLPETIRVERATLAGPLKRPRKDLSKLIVDSRALILLSQLINHWRFE
jgi:hypothetical protein